jgi:hypothetical protein
MFDRLASLEQRIQVLEDIAAIKEMKANYWVCVDRQQPELLRDYLTDDAFIDMDGVPVTSASRLSNLFCAPVVGPVFLICMRGKTRA